MVADILWFVTLFHTIVTLFIRRLRKKVYLCTRKQTTKSNKIKQLLIFVTMLAGFPFQHVSAQRLGQPLDCGVVAAYRSGGRSVTSSGGTGYLISWRKLAIQPVAATRLPSS